MDFEHSVQESKATLDSLWLESCELLAGLPSASKIQLINSATTRSYARGETMFSAGDRVEKVLLLLGGCVKLTQTTEAGSEVILRFHRPGEVVGLPDWVPGNVHFYTAQALDECSVLVWNAKTMQAAKERFPQLHRNASKMFGRALNKLQMRYCALMTGEVTARLAQGLVHLLGEIGQQANSHVAICLSQEELGQVTAVSPWEVCRELRRWEREGLVRVRREVIEVQDVPGLLSLCKVNRFPRAVVCG